MTVKEKFQGQGIGSMLVQRCVDDAFELELNEVFVLTNKPEFYFKMNFAMSKVTKFPMKIWSECVGCKKFFSCKEIIMSIDIIAL